MGGISPLVVPTGRLVDILSVNAKSSSCHFSDSGDNSPTGGDPQRIGRLSVTVSVCTKLIEIDPAVIEDPTLQFKV